MSDTDLQSSGLQLFKRLLEYSRNRKLALFIAMTGMIAVAISDWAIAAMMKPLMDDGFIAKDKTSMLLIPATLAGIMFFRSIFYFIGSYSLEWVGRRIVFDIRNQLFEHMMRLPSSYYDATSSATLISKLIYDVEQLAAAATFGLFVLVRSGFTLIILFAWMIYLNWKLTLLFLVLVPVLALLIRIMSKRLRRISYRIQNSMGDISKVTQEAVEGHRIVKAFRAQKKEIATFFRANNYNRQQAMKLTVMHVGGTPLIELLAGIVVSIIIYFSLFQAQDGHFSAGDFVSYLTAMIMLMPAARNLTQVNQTIQKGVAASHSAFSLLDLDAEEDTGTVEIETLRGKVVYQNVNFQYKQSEEKAITDVSFSIEPGQMVALVGASGSGKSTIANLLARFYRVNEGAILIDDTDINDFRLGNLRDHIAIVTQETILFDDTLANNITYGGSLDDERLHKAAFAAHVLEFVERLPEGMDTGVGEKGLRLSGGQRQRVAIARAIYKNAPILILDEATSALDTKSERHVQAAMEALTEHRTTLVIAHRLSTIERADRIIVMDRGRVVESGAHAELMQAGGIYAGLYHMQFQPAS